MLSKIVVCSQAIIPKTTSHEAKLGEISTLTVIFVNTEGARDVELVGVRVPLLPGLLDCALLCRKEAPSNQDPAMPWGEGGGRHPHSDVLILIPHQP